MLNISLHVSFQSKSTHWDHHKTNKLSQKTWFQSNTSLFVIILQLELSVFVLEDNCQLTIAVYGEIILQLNASTFAHQSKSGTLNAISKSVVIFQSHISNCTGFHNDIVFQSLS